MRHVSPHKFQHRGWRFWICTCCYAPRSMHPRTDWVVERPWDDNRYVEPDEPLLKAGW